MQFFPFKNKYSHGFTLMEVMVSVSIFSIIITIGIGSLLTINTTVQQTRADRQAMDSLSYVLDTMTRQIRTGMDYEGGGSSISFKRQDGDVSSGGSGEEIIFFEQDNQIFMSIAGNSFDITPVNVIMNNLDFEIINDTGMPYVTIRMSATVQSGKRDSALAIQTGVSQRTFPVSSSQSSGSGNPDPSVIPIPPPETP
jgi:prepilin-type N-terminal cleavage/methylation domain-containing protein